MFTKLAIVTLAMRFTLASAATAACSYTYCNSCVPGGSGPPVCDNEPYYHNAATGGSCSDSQQPFNSNFCSTFGSLTTPYGKGTWKAASGCNASNAAGTLAGTITGSGFSCTCKNAPKSTASNDCGGIEYACNTVWTCQCTN